MTQFVSAQKADPKSPPADLPSAAKEIWSPLGLPRLKTKAKPGEAAPLAAEAYDVTTLTVPANAKGSRTLQRGNINLLELDTTGEWSSPLQKSGKDPLCVSFLLCASDATVIAVDGAWLGVAQSPIHGCLQVMIGEAAPDGIKWKEARIHILEHTYGGSQMIQLPLLTVRLDPKAGVWDLYTESRQVADGIPLGKTKGSDANAGKFLVRAGKGKAWLCGLVQTGDNPLFEDSNGNGIDDNFERTKKGALLPATLSPEQRAATAKEWRETTAGEAWLIQTPRPD